VPTKEELKKDTIDTYTNTGGTGNINLSPIPEIGPENDITINVS
jgi:hypothetical protein